MKGLVGGLKIVVLCVCVCMGVRDVVETEEVLVGIISKIGLKRTYFCTSPSFPRGHTKGDPFRDDH